MKIDTDIRVVLSLLALCAALIGPSVGCSGKSSRPDSQAGKGAAERTPTPLEALEPVEGSEATTMRLALSEAPVEGDGTLEAGEGSDKDEGEGSSGAIRPTLVALSEERIETLLGEALVGEADGEGGAQNSGGQGGDRADWRVDGPEAPRVSGEVAMVLPPAAGRLEPLGLNSGPLHLIRYAPTGRVPMAKHLSVTFSRPMIELPGAGAGSAEQGPQPAMRPPVKLEPEPAGRWRWVGSRTLVFEPEAGRLPMATDFTVTVPESAASVAGIKMEKPRSWSFQTPALDFEQIWPGSGEKAGRRPMILMTFNQRVDREAVAEHLWVHAKRRVWRLEAPGEETDGSSGIPGGFTLEGGLEVLGSDEVRDFAEEAGYVDMPTDLPEGRWLAVRPTEPLPADALVAVVLPAKTPSSEGPRTPRYQRTRSFRTHGPFQFERSRCGGRRGRCATSSKVTVRLSNPVDENAFERSMVTLRPEWPEAEVEVKGSQLVIEGRKPGNRTVEVTLSSALADIFGQTLGEERSVEFQVEPTPADIGMPGGRFAVVEPERAADWAVHSVNYRRLKLEVRRVTPDDWEAYLQATKRRSPLFGGRRKSGTPKPLPGTSVWTKEVDVDAGVEEVARVPVELSKALGKEGTGHALVVAEPLDRFSGVRRGRVKQREVSWVQVTSLGLQAYVDDGALLARVTSLADGAPLEGIEVAMSHGKATAKTDAEGLAELSLPDEDETAARDWVRAARGGDVAFLPRRTGLVSGVRGLGTMRKRSGTWHRDRREDRLKWFVFDDRKIYEPSETVRAHGWVRRQVREPEGGLEIPERAEYRWHVRGYGGKTWAEGKGTLTEEGRFSLSFRVPEEAKLGSGRLRIYPVGEKPDQRVKRRRSRFPGMNSADAAYHRFDIRRFASPDRRLDIHAGRGPHFAGDSIRLEGRARTGKGGALAGEPVEWRVETRQSSFDPPNLGDYAFGETTQGWWRRLLQAHRTSSLKVQFAKRKRPKVEYEWRGHTDERGRHAVRAGLDLPTPPRPMRVTARAEMGDGELPVVAEEAVTVHPARYYVGLRTDGNFVEAGGPLEVRAVVADVEGRLRAGHPVKMRASRLVHERDSDEGWSERRVDTRSCELVSGESPESCTFKELSPGVWVIRATTADEEGRRNFTEIVRAVGGGDASTVTVAGDDELEMVPDAQEYAPGDTARILVRAPFAPAHAFVTVRRDGLLERRQVLLESGVGIVEVPVEAAHVPGMHVDIDVTGRRGPAKEKGEKEESGAASGVDDGSEPGFASGDLFLSVSPSAHRLEVQLEPSDPTPRPGETSAMTVTVRDAAGELVRDAEVALVMLDDARLRASGEDGLPDPLDTFYSHRADGVRDYQLQTALVRLEEVLMMEGGPMVRNKTILGAIGTGKVHALGSLKGDSISGGFGGLGLRGSGRGGGGDFERRARLRQLKRQRKYTVEMDEPSAPSVGEITPLRTDAEGRARFEVELPDRPARYRAMAVVADGSADYGAGEAVVEARAELDLRVDLPDFVRWGDSLEIPVEIRNNAKDQRHIEVAARADGLELSGRRGAAFTLPGGASTVVYLPAKTREVGEAGVTVVATASVEGGAEETSRERVERRFRVRAPFSAERSVGHGRIGGDGQRRVLGVRRPTDALPWFGSLRVSTSADLLLGAVDAFREVYERVGDGEQVANVSLANRILVTLAMRDSLKALDLEGLPDEAALRETLQRDVERLAGRLRFTGRFRDNGAGNYDWLSSHLNATHALLRAAEAGLIKKEEFSRVDRVFGRLPRYLRSRAVWWSGELGAYGAFVYGPMEGPKTRKLPDDSLLHGARQSHSQTTRALAWLLASFAGDDAKKDVMATVAKELNGRISVSDGKVEIQEPRERYRRSQSGLLGGGRAVTLAVVLYGLLEGKPDSDLIPVLADALLEERRNGRWESTLANVWAVLALAEYDGATGEGTERGAAAARAWLDGAFAGEKSSFVIPVRDLKAADGADEAGRLVLQKSGEGPMYYRVGMNWASEASTVRPVDRGLGLVRRYEAVDDPDDVRRADDGSWRVKAGARVRVTLALGVPTLRRDVELRDRLPAGFTPVEPVEPVAGTIPQRHLRGRRGSSNRYWWWERPWFQKQSLHADGAAVYAAQVYGDVHEYSYIARADTPGEYVAPPARAGERRDPEIYGKTGAARVIVER